MSDREKIEKFLSGQVHASLGRNKKEELIRLIHEILLMRSMKLSDLVCEPDLQAFLVKNLQGTRKFLELKRILLRWRYPVSVTTEKNPRFYLPPLPSKEHPQAVHPGKSFQPRRLYVAEDVKDREIVRSVQKNFPECPVEYFSSLSDLSFDRSRMLTDLGKQDLYFIQQTGMVFKPCPCTSGAVNCGYKIFNLGFGCPYDCSYCYLQHYMNVPGILLPVDLESVFIQAKEFIRQGSYRIGTGEFFDSLALDHIVPYSRELIRFFGGQELLFELKTKSNQIGNLLDIKPVHKNIVISWSLNPVRVIHTEEKGTASLQERLLAAAAVQKAGYRTGFHFDPVIWYPGWEKEYEETVGQLFSMVKETPAWISLGALRFYRRLKQIVDIRFPDDPYFLGELILDPMDGKMRYPRVIRMDIYKKMISWIRKYSKDTPVYLCMEDKGMWKEVMGSVPQPVDKNLFFS